MKLGRVIGRLVLSKKDAGLARGGFMILVSPMDKSMLANPEASKLSTKLPNLVVYDTLGAAQDDIVSYVEGAEATASFDTPIPIDAYNVGIVDRFSYNPKVS